MRVSFDVRPTVQVRRKASMSGIVREDPLNAHLLLGSIASLAVSALNLSLLVERLPARVIWGATAIGGYQLQVNRMAVAMGGPIRVGLEDISGTTTIVRTSPRTRDSLNGWLRSAGPWVVTRPARPRVGILLEIESPMRAP